MQKILNVKNLNVIAVTLFSIVIFTADLLLPLGVAGGVPYIVVVFISIWLMNIRYLLAVSTITSILVLAGYIYSPDGGVGWMVVSNRLLAIFAIGVTTIVGVMWIKARMKLYEAKYDREDRIRLLLDATAEAIIGIDKEGKCTFANPASARLLGYDSVENILGVSACDFTQEDPKGENSDVSRCIFMSVMVSGSGVCDNLAYFYKKDRTAIPVELRVSPIMDRQDNIVGAVGTFFDITEKKKMEEELLRAQRLDSLGVFAGGIAHDFNNMLTGILGNISMLKEQVEEDSSGYKICCGVENAARNAGELTKQLLTFSKGGAPVKETIEVGGLLEESVNFALRGSNITYEINIADNLSVVKADKGQLNQVLNNIIINASQAMVGGGLLTVSADNCCSENKLPRQLKEDKYIKITIKDNGSGIEEDILENIYDPYFTTKAEGSGLGLASVYSIVKRHGGYVDVQSVFGLGAEFTIYLPACAERPASSKTQRQKGLRKGLKVLLMDDDEIIRSIVGEFLLKFECEYESASEGASAIDLYKRSMEEKKPFDVVIMDLTVRGGMGGIEATRELFKVDPNAKVIVSSGYSDSSVISNFREFGFCAVLPKPYVKADFIQAINEIEF